MNDSRRPAAAGAPQKDSTEDSAAAKDRTPPNTCTVIHDRGSEDMRFNRENLEKLPPDKAGVVG